MSSRISDILSEVSWGIARPNRYRIEIAPPPKLWLSGSGSRKLSALAEITELPGKHMATLERKTYGPIRKMPYSVVYNELPVTFICTATMDERRYFDAWQAIISDPNTYYFEYYDSFVTTITIKPIDESGYYWYSITLREAYPVTIQAQPLGYADNNSYMKLNVTFAYRDFITYDQSFVPVSDSTSEFSMDTPINAAAFGDSVNNPQNSIIQTQTPTGVSASRLPAGVTTELSNSEQEAVRNTIDASKNKIEVPTPLGPITPNN